MTMKKMVKVAVQIMIIAWVINMVRPPSSNKKLNRSSMIILRKGWVIAVNQYLAGELLVRPRS